MTQTLLQPVLVTCGFKFDHCVLTTDSSRLLACISPIGCLFSFLPRLAFNLDLSLWLQLGDRLETIFLNIIDLFLHERLLRLCLLSQFDVSVVFE